MKKLLYALTAFGMVACGKGGNDIPANQLASNDFESLDGWIGDQPITSLTKEKAHSGRYSIKVDPNIEYSLGFNMLLGKLSTSKLKKIKIHAWVNVPNAKSAVVLVTQITNPADNNKQLLWEGVNMGNEVKTLNKWVEIEKTITVPDNATYNDKLGVYLWRTSSPETIYLDDLTIERVDG